MNIKGNILSSIFFGVIVLGSILFTLYVNGFFSNPAVYGSYLFLSQTSKSTIISYFFISIALYSIARKLINEKDLERYNNSSCLIFYYVISFSFIYKIFLLKFNIVTEDVTNHLDNIFISGHFNQYKLYSYIAYFVTLLTDHYNIVLTYFNIIMGSLVVGIVYKLIYRINHDHLIALTTSALLLFFMPINMIQLLLRVDMLFLILFIYTLYSLFKQIDTNKYKQIIILNLAVLLMCLCRESTLYMLPLFILLGMFIKEKRLLTLISMSSVILIASFFVSSFNLDEYGMKSRVKNYHLIYNMLHYGYFNDSVSNEIKGELSSNALLLYNDIDNSYRNTVPPHKRTDFTPKYSWIKPLFRSDTENVLKKSKLTKYNGDFKLSKKILSDALNNINDNISYIELDKKLSVSYLNLENQEQKELTIFLKNQLIHTFLLDSYQLNGKPKIECLEDNSITNHEHLLFNIDCVKNKLLNIGEPYIYVQSDNWSYKKLILPFVWNFNSISKKYTQHPQIKYINEIALVKPELYVSQSILTIIGMSGFMPEMSGIGIANKIYDDPIIPKYIIISFQKFYALIFNFWYLFALLSILGSFIFINNSRNKRNNILISFITLYYGSFIVFAAQFEFSRLTIPIAPFIIYNYVIIIAYISSVFIKYDKK